MDTLFTLVTQLDAGTTIYLDDDGSHLIDDRTHQDNCFYLDSKSANNPGAYLQLDDGGRET